MGGRVLEGLAEAKVRMTRGWGNKVSVEAKALVTLVEVGMETELNWTELNCWSGHIPARRGMSSQ